MLETNHECILFLGDCRFVSATFRLFKLPKTGPTQKCQVIYNGGITGHEKELIFDANFTFKVTKDFHDFQHSSSSYFCSTNLFLILHCFSLFWSWYMCMCLCVCLYTHKHTHILVGFPGDSVVRICLRCRRPRFEPWVKKIPWRRKCHLTPVFLPGKSHGLRSLAGYSPWCQKRVRHDLVTKQQQIYIYIFAKPLKCKLQIS